MTKFPHTETWLSIFMWILQGGGVQEQQGRCPTVLQEPEALHLDHFLSPEGLHTGTSSLNCTCAK